MLYRKATYLTTLSVSRLAGGVIPFSSPTNNLELPTGASVPANPGTITLRLENRSRATQITTRLMRTKRSGAQRPKPGSSPTSSRFLWRGSGSYALCPGARGQCWISTPPSVQGRMV